MSQQHQGRIHLCLLWTFVLTSITIQLGFITYYFNEHHHRQLMKTPGSKVVTAQATEVKSGKIQWKLEKTENQLLSLEDGNMTILEDGYYFISLQVTLRRFSQEKGKVHTVRIKNDKNKVFLEGEIANSSLSTGFLGRVKELSAGNKLVVTIEPTADINFNSGSRLGIIYLSDHV